MQWSRQLKVLFDVRVYLPYFTCNYLLKHHLYSFPGFCYAYNLYKRNTILLFVCNKILLLFSLKMR